MYKSILIATTAALALATIYNFVHCETNSFTSGFANGFGALILFDLWLDE